MNLFSCVVSVSIVTCNQNDPLNQCLRSVCSQSHNNLEIIIVNNYQAEILLDKQECTVPLKIINNKSNLYYAKAMNLGIEASSGEFVLCLNDDIVLDVNFIKDALSGFYKDDKIGMVSGKVLSFYDNGIIDSTGLFLARSRKPLDRGYKSLDRGQYDKEGYIFGVPGAVGIYKRQMLKDISIGNDFFDSTFGIFYEDLDLCWRANNKGWKAYYIPQACAYHKRGATVKEYSPGFKYLKKYNFSFLAEGLQVMLIKNRYRTIVKNDELQSFLKNLIFILGYEMKLWLYIFIAKPVLLYKLFKDISWFKNSFSERNRIKMQAVTKL